MPIIQCKNPEFQVNCLILTRVNCIKSDTDLVKVIFVWNTRHTCSPIVLKTEAEAAEILARKWRSRPQDAFHCMHSCEANNLTIIITLQFDKVIYLRNVGAILSTKEALSLTAVPVWYLSLSTMVSDVTQQPAKIKQ